MRAAAPHPRRAPQRSEVRAAIRCAIPRTQRWAGVAAPTQRNTTHALDRARRASDVINISNYTGDDDIPWLIVQPARPATAIGTSSRATASSRPRGSRAGRHAGHVLAIFGTIVLSWVAAIPRRLGNWLFAMNDTEAYWHGWEITKTRGGLGRRYRDPQFDTLAECPKCRGSGASRGAGSTGTADLPCLPCLGTGRITLAEVS